MIYANMHIGNCFLPFSPSFKVGVDAVFYFSIFIIIIHATLDKCILNLIVICKISACEICNYKHMFIKTLQKKI